MVDLVERRLRDATEVARTVLNIWITDSRPFEEREGMIALAEREWKRANIALSQYLSHVTK